MAQWPTVGSQKILTPRQLEYLTATTDAGPSADALVKSCVAGGDPRFATPAAIMNELRRSSNDYLRLAQKLEQISPNENQMFSAIANQYYLRQQTGSRELKSGDSLAIVSKQGYSIGVQSVDNSAFPMVSVIMQVADANGRNVPGLGINDFRFRDSSIRIVSVQPTDATLSVPVDIVLMIDCSGSMGDEIDAVRNNVQSFVKTMEARGADYRIGGVLYGSKIYDTLHPTSNLNRFREFADQADAIGGDEISSLAIREAASMRFRPDAQRVLVMITDDWVMQDNSRLTESDLTEMLWDKGARLYSIQNACRNNNAITTRLTLGREYDIQSPFNSILDEIGTDITTTYKLVYESKLKQEEVAPAVPAVLRGRITEAKPGGPLLPSFC
ncbi:MAG: von Willebrand factor type A domain protein [Chlorobi bacterium OLB7]|nr:MAG: von Willebrand factor type A domain protein [Chlorobi bacterium OLB7]